MTSRILAKIKFSRKFPDLQYLALIRSSLEYSSVVWDPHLQKDIEKLKKIQRQAARSISGDYSSRDQGCVTRMLKDLAIPLLQDRRKANRLVFFCKVVEGQVPALPCHDYLTQIRNKRQIKSKQFTDCITQNIIDKQSTNNSKCFKPTQCNSVLFRNSFFPTTVIDWNHLEDSVVNQKAYDFETWYEASGNGALQSLYKS